MKVEFFWCPRSLWHLIVGKLKLDFQFFNAVRHEYYKFLLFVIIGSNPYFYL